METASANLEDGGGVVVVDCDQTTSKCERVFLCNPGRALPRLEGRLQGPRQPAVAARGHTARAAQSRLLASRRAVRGARTEKWRANAFCIH